MGIPASPDTPACFHLTLLCRQACLPAPLSAAARHGRLHRSTARSMPVVMRHRPGQAQGQPGALPSAAASAPAALPAEPLLPAGLAGSAAAAARSAGRRSAVYPAPAASSSSRSLE